MRHRNNHYSVAIDAIDQTVWEASHEATSDTWLNFGARQRKLYRSSHGSIEFIEEPLADTFILLVVPGDRTIQFLLRELKETYLHERRCFAITVS